MKNIFIILLQLLTIWVVAGPVLLVGLISTVVTRNPYHLNRASYLVKKWYGI